MNILKTTIVVICLISLEIGAQTRPVKFSNENLSSLNTMLLNGDNCSNAIPICDSIQIASMNSYNAGSLTPTCFSGFIQRDIWFKITISQAGVLEWLGTPNNSNVEFDWSLYLSSTGCSGINSASTPIACNYNYITSGSNTFGMNSSISTCTGEFCPSVNVNANQDYYLLIDNYTNNFTGFKLSLSGSTCQFDCSVGIENSNINENIKVFPNPANSFININSNLLPNKYELSLVDLSGIIIKTELISSTKDTFEVSEIEEGFYIIQIRSLSSFKVVNKKICIKH